MIKTALIRFGSLAVGVATLGGALFAATPAFAYYSNYNSYQYTPSYQSGPVYGSSYPYTQQQQTTNVCTSRFSPNCIIQETESFLAPSYQSEYNQNPYGGYNTYQPAPTYGNQYHTNPYSTGYTNPYQNPYQQQAPTYGNQYNQYGNQSPYMNYGSNMSSGYYGYQYQYSYHY